MEEIDIDNALNDKIYALTHIIEIRNRLGSAVSCTDTWFPHVAKNIVCSWGTLQFREYANTLFYTTRGNRAGFPSEVLNELHEVVLLHHELFPQYEPVKSSYL